jgi:hypothetical protein
MDSLSLPNDICEKIILDSIILKKNSLGWLNVHEEILLFKKSVTINDLYSTDENGFYLDDMCEIMYW